MVNDIRSVRLVDAMPQVVMRTNGYSFGGVNLGRFKAKDGATGCIHIRAKARSYKLRQMTVGNVM